MVEFVIKDSSDELFKEMVEQLVDFAEYDPDLFDAIQYLDLQARKRGISFYDIVFEKLYNYDTNLSAKEWLKNRS